MSKTSNLSDMSTYFNISFEDLRCIRFFMRTRSRRTKPAELVSSGSLWPLALISNAVLFDPESVRDSYYVWFIW